MLPIQDIRTKLLAQRRDLFRQAARTEEDLLWLETDVEREKREIEAIDLALTRIEAGSYGRCQGCDKDIPVARLQAMPTATRCLACGKAIEALK